MTPNLADIKHIALYDFSVPATKGHAPAYLEMRFLPWFFVM